MTAIIISILAALGIGGGFVIANNTGGSGGGGSASVVIKGEKQDYTASVNPNYNLISALTDTTQYQNPTVADSGVFEKEYKAAALHTYALAAESDYQGYGNPADDLRNGYIRGGQIPNTNYSTILDLIRITNSFHIFSFEGTSIDNYGNLESNLYAFNLTAGNLVENGNSRYKTFTKTDSVITSPNNLVSFHHYNSVHLGGASLGLTVADFGQWEENSWTDNNGIKNEYVSHNKTFFFYDENFAYRNRYYKNNVSMEGNVLVSVLTDNNSPENAYNLQTGSISMDLDLTSKRITNGQVIMDDENYRADYNVYNFTGAIAGSVFMIDGTGWQHIDPQAGSLRGGVGKLLIGRDGLEMVGNFTKQITYNGEDDDRGKADYTFGAKERI